MKEIGTTCNGNHVLELTDEEFKTFIRLKQTHAAQLELRPFTFMGVPLLDYLPPEMKEPHSLDFDRERMGKFTEQQIIDDVNSNLSLCFFFLGFFRPEINSKIEHDVIFINVKDNDIGFECDRSLPVTRIFSEYNGLLDIVNSVLKARSEYVFQQQEQVNEGEQI